MPTLFVVFQKQHLDKRFCQQQLETFYQIEEEEEPVIVVLPPDSAQQPNESDEEDDDKHLDDERMPTEISGSMEIAYLQRCLLKR